MAELNGTGYKLQASKNTADGWIFVARGNSEEELDWAMDIIKRKMGKVQDPATAWAPKTYCKVEGCGAEAEDRRGVKNGKPWHGVFCRVNKEHVTWVHDKV